MTVQEMINAALRRIRVLDPGETPSATESADALLVLNQLLASWSLEGTMIPKITEVSIAMTGAASYTQAGLLRILAASSENSGISRETQVVDAARWSQAGPDMAEGSKFAELLYFDGNDTLRVWPVPANGGALKLRTLQAMTAFGALADNVSVYTGYEHALIYALAHSLAEEYGKPLDEAFMVLANGAKGAVIKRNAEVLGTAGAAPAAA